MLTKHCGSWALLFPLSRSSVETCVEPGEITGDASDRSQEFMTEENQTST